jgi:hypothetical protein
MFCGGAVSCAFMHVFKKFMMTRQASLASVRSLA